MAIGTISALLAAAQLGAGLYGMSKRMKDRSGQERIRQLLAQAKAGNLRDAQAIAGSGAGINPALAQRAALDAVTEANAEAERSAMNQEAAMAERDRTRTDRLTGGVLGSLGTFGSQLLAARDTSDDKGELDPIIAAKMREASLREGSGNTLTSGRAPVRTRQEVDPTAPAAPPAATSTSAEPEGGDSMNLAGLGDDLEGRDTTLMGRFLRGELNADEMKAMGQQIDSDVEAAAVDDAIMDEDIARRFTEDEGLFPQRRVARHIPTGSERIRLGLSPEPTTEEIIAARSAPSTEETLAGLPTQFPIVAGTPQERENQRRSAQFEQIERQAEEFGGHASSELQPRVSGSPQERASRERLEPFLQEEAPAAERPRRRRRQPDDRPADRPPTTDEAAVARAESLLEWEAQRAEADAAARRTHQTQLDALTATPSGSLAEVQAQIERQQRARDRLESDESARQERFRRETETERRRRTSEVAPVSSAAPTEQPLTSQIPGWGGFERRVGAQRSQAALAALSTNPDAFLSAANNPYGLQVGSQLVTALKARNMGVLDYDGWIV